jgi:hypothetical protein
LIQIRHGYTAACHDLRLSVETDAEGWKAQVRDRNDGRTVYSVRRCSLRAAQVAAAEFAVFRVGEALGPISPEAMAQRLRWSAYW